MADFALWATACETALWPSGTFWSAYCGNRDEAVEGVIDADPIAAAVRALMQARTEWTGTASDLLGALAEIAGERVTKAKTWPDNPRALAGRLRRAATFLRKIGIDIGFEREGRARTRTIRITTAGRLRVPETEAASVRFVRVVRRSSESQSSQRLQASRLADVRQHCGRFEVENCATVRTDPLKDNLRPMRTGVDEDHPRQSAQEIVGTQALGHRYEHQETRQRTDDIVCRRSRGPKGAAERTRRFDVR
ncbi:MAG: hypothetical protein IPK23_09375 [Rhizobiales bacterium]|nr:hypothetical protein [Hyphomicrobiales bacterium]